MDKSQDTICAIADDMSGSQEKGYLVIGVRNNSETDGLKVDDALMKKTPTIRQLIGYLSPTRFHNLSH